MVDTIDKFVDIYWRGGGGWDFGIVYFLSVKSLVNRKKKNKEKKKERKKKWKNFLEIGRFKRQNVNNRF